MEAIDWSVLINNHLDEINTVALAGIEEAVKNNNLTVVVEISEEGRVYSWHHAGGNTCTYSAYEGTSYPLMSFRYEESVINYDINEEILIENMRELQISDDTIFKLQKQALEEETTLEIIMMENDDKQINRAYQNAYNSELQMWLDTCAEEIIIQLLELTINALEIHMEG